MGSEHGGLNYSQLRKEGIDPNRILDFSVSINPAALPDRVREKFQNSCITRYPDSGSTHLREKIAEFNNIPVIENILVVNGTSQGIFLIVQALINERDRIGIVSPSYSEYYDACSLRTDKIDLIHMRGQADFQFPLQVICSYIENASPRMIWICSPNNPTGTYLDERSFEMIRQSCLESDTLLLLDEAYICFVPEEHRYNALRKNVLILRSMTKDFGFPGLRLGYLMGEEIYIEKIKKWQPDWSINAPAQEAGIAGFEEIEYYRQSWREIIRKRQDMRKDLNKMGLQTYASNANFFLMEIDDIEALKAHLWQDCILIRDCRSFGLEKMIRIGVNTDGANGKLINSIKEYLEI